MKQLLTTVAFLVWSIASYASDTTIVFSDIEYKELFELASKENKPVMLFFHFDGCKPCVKMEKTAFKDKAVYELFNANYINFEVNTRKDPGIDIEKIFKINSYPTFIFLDSSGKELHKIFGYYSPEDFLIQAQNVLNKDKTLSNYSKLYEEGNRGADFLFDYSYMLKNVGQLDSVVVNEYLDAIDSSEYLLEKNIRYIYEFCIYKFKIFIPFHNPHFQVLLENEDEFYTYFDEDQVTIRIAWILNAAVRDAILGRDEATFYEVIEILKEYEFEDILYFNTLDSLVIGALSTENLVLSSKLGFYDVMGDKTNYTLTLEMYLPKIWDDAQSLNTFAWSTYENASDEDRELIQTAIACSERSIELKNNYINNDTLAALLFKSGDKEKALIQAVKAIEIARATNKDYSATQKLIKKYMASE